MSTTRRAQPQQAPANLAPIVTVVGVIGALVATWFALPGAAIAAIAVSIAGFFYQPPLQLDPKAPIPDAVSAKRQRWQQLRWRGLIPNEDWLFNHPRQLDAFRDAAKKRLPGIAGDALGVLTWALVPTRFTTLLALALALMCATLPANLVIFAQHLPPEAVTWDFVWLNVILAYGFVAGVDGAIRRTAALYDPSPGVTFATLSARLRDGDGGAWRALIGFALLAIATAVGTTLTLIALDVTYLFVPWMLVPLTVGLAVFAGCMHGALRTAALEPWRDTVRTRAEWGPRWEALKNPDIHMVSHERIGPFVVDTFEAPPLLGSGKAMNLYASIVPYLSQGGETRVAMLTVPATDGQGQPIPGSAHATRFRVAWCPAETELDAFDTGADIAQLSIAAEMGAFFGANAYSMPVPVLLTLRAAHTPDSPRAVWESEWTTALPSAYAVGEFLGVGESLFTEDRVAYFGDFDNATLFDERLPGRMEKASYNARWAQRFTDALKMGEKPPYPQYEAFAEREFTRGITVTRDAFLVAQGLSPMQFFTKDLRQRILTTMNAVPFLGVIGVTGQLVPGGSAGPGLRYEQGFCVIASQKPIPSNPAEIAPPPRARQGAPGEVAGWVFGVLINKAFEDAKLPFPEVIRATPMTTMDSAGHIWCIELRLYEGVTSGQVKANVAKLQQSLGGVPWLRIAESEYGCNIYAGIPPRTEGVAFARPGMVRICDELDWAQAYTDAKVVAVTDGRPPQMMESAALETNDKVQRTVFAMPAGMNLGTVRAAQSKLQASTGMGYVDVRAGDSPDKFVVLSALVDPIPFPAFPDWELMADTEGKKRTRLPFAQTTDGSVVVYDWAVDPHLQVLGQSGGGKPQPLTSRLPVPRSERYPDGWATVGELRVGDDIFTPDGSTHRVDGFTREVDEDAYVVCFDDGQEVVTGARHIWRVQSPSAVPSATADASRIEALVETVAPGLAGSAYQIAQLAGVSERDLRPVLHPALARQGLLKTDKQTTVYAMEDVVPHLHGVIERWGSLAYAGRVFKAYDIDYLELGDSWLSVRNFADALAGRRANRAEIQQAKGFLRRAQARSRRGPERRLVNLYPTDETLHLYARYLRGIRERLIHTEDMFASSDRFAVALAEPFDAPARRGDVLRGQVGKRESRLRQSMNETPRTFRTVEQAERVAELARGLGRKVRLDDTTVTLIPHTVLTVTNVRRAGVQRMRCLRVNTPDKMYLTDGFIPTHNSILLQMLMCGAILRGCDVFMIDPIKGGQDFDFAHNYMRGVVEQGDYVGAGELLQVIGQEAEDRKKLNVQYKVGNYKDLPDGVRPPHMFVIIDEFQSLLKSKTRIPKQPDSDDEMDVAQWTEQHRINGGVDKVGKHIGKLAREARSVGITLVLAGQGMKATELQAVGLGGLKTNFSRIAVGKMSYGDLSSSFKDPSALPSLGEVVPPGRGIFESTGGSAVIIQNWWEKGEQPELRRQLEARVPHMDESRRVDISALTERVLNAAPKAFGEVISEFEVVEDEEETVIEVSADDLGLSFDDLSFDDDDTLPSPADEDVSTLPPEDAPMFVDEGDSAPPFADEDASTPPFEDEPVDDTLPDLAGHIVIGTDVVFGGNIPLNPDSPTPLLEAFELVLTAFPAITEVTYPDAPSDLHERLQDIAAGLAVPLNLPVAHDEPVPAERDEPVPVERDEPTEQPAERPARVIVDDSLLEGKTVVPPLLDDSMFD